MLSRISHVIYTPSQVKMNQLELEPKESKDINQTERHSASSNMAGIASKSSYDENTSLLNEQSTESGTAYASDGETDRNVSYPYADVCVCVIVYIQ